MNEISKPSQLDPLESLIPSADASLEMILQAWETATSRLQETHESLRCEVKRLSDELEVKNRQLALKNRLADLGQMASHIAHEIRNNLVPVSLYVSLLHRRMSEDSSNLEIVKNIESGMTALETTVNDLLHFTSQREPQLQKIKIDLLIHEAVMSLAPQLLAQGIKADVDVPENLMASLDRDMIRRALLNLMFNAMDVMPEGGELTITVVDGPEGLEIEVADEGPGITLEKKNQLFEPFFTTKNDGTGLGLAIVQRIVEVHGGVIDVLNCPQGGAAFTMRFPRLAMKAAA